MENQPFSPFSLLLRFFFLFLVSLSRVEDSNAGKRKMNLVSLESKRNIK
jgi:hypothetical protein